MMPSSDYMGKQELQRSIFPDGIFYSKKNRETRTTKINSLFALIARQKGVSEEKETGISEVIFKNSGLVEAGCTRSNFIKGLKLIEDYMQVGRY